MPHETRAPAGPLQLAVIGAGPAGLALALLAARALPRASVTVYDARPADHDVSADGRTLALSLGSLQLLDALGLWRGGVERSAQPITEVHVSQQGPALGGLPLPWRPGGAPEPEVRIRAVDERVPQLGAVLAYGALVAPLQAAWLARCAAEPGRLGARFGTPVAALKPVAGGVEVDAGIAEPYTLAVVAEGGVFARQARKALHHDYGQTAWVGSVEVPQAPPGVAYERFTRHGPVALLPLPPGPGGGGRAALVWCVDSRDDPVAGLSDAQRLAVLNTLVPPEVGTLTALSPLKRFPLGLNAQRRLVEGRTVRIGNAAQTLHPVAGQGLNLGLRDAHELVEALRREGDPDAALRRVERARAPDRWTMIAATDFLARSFTWTLPGAAAARGLGMAALQALGPAKSLLARRMMFGSR